MSTSSPLRRPLTAAIATALSAALLVSGAASAQTAKEQELEARIQQLERQIQQLLGQQEQQQSAISQTQSQLDQVRTAQAAAPAGQTIQSTTILPGSPANSRFTVGGMIRMDAMWTETSDGTIAKNTAGRDFYVPGAIPVTTAQRFESPDAYFDAHAKFSRLWFDASSTLDNGSKLGARIEVDFFGGSLGNTRATNTYGTVVRHAYVTYNHWLAGQTWSNFMNTGALLDSVDIFGPVDALVVVRQPQLRYTRGGWSFSLENPETTVGTSGSGHGNNSMPDFTAAYTHSGDFGHIKLSGLARQLKTSDGLTDTGYGLSLSGLFKLGSNTDVRYQLTAGDGVGRYIGLSTVVPDAYLKTRRDGGFELESLGGWAAYAGIRHVIRPGLRGNLYYSTSHWDNDTFHTGFGVTQKVQSWHGNLIWSPVPKLDFGVELMWGERTLESGHNGELTRVHTMARYSF